MYWSSSAIAGLVNKFAHSDDSTQIVFGSNGREFPSAVLNIRQIHVPKTWNTGILTPNSTAEEYFLRKSIRNIENNSLRDVKANRKYIVLMQPIRIHNVIVSVTMHDIPNK